MTAVQHGKQRVNVQLLILEEKKEGGKEVR